MSVVKVTALALLIAISESCGAAAMKSSESEAVLIKAAILKAAPASYSWGEATILEGYALAIAGQGEAAGTNFCLRKRGARWAVTGSFASKGVTPADLAAKYCHWTSARYRAVYNARSHQATLFP